MQTPQKIRGTQDFLPDYHNYFTFLKKVFRHEFRKNGFRRINTPIIETKELFEKSLGVDCDIINKELYTLHDKKGREIVLKPDNTPGIMRAYIENEMNLCAQPVYLYYIDPVFRQGMLNKGRYRQFYQFGAEIIGENDPILEVQLMYITNKIFNDIGLKGDFTLKINSVGIYKEREKYLEELRNYYHNKEHLLTEEGKAKLEKNPISLLDSNDEDEKILANEAPKMTKFLKKKSKEHFEKVKEYLEILNVPYEEDHKLVRGLDYYTNTVWEFVENKTHNSLSGGGRYDTMSKMMGYEEEIPATGFSVGAERIIEAIISNGLKIKNKDEIDLYFIQLGDDAKKVVLPLSLEAREKGINTLTSLGTPSLNIQMKKATKIGAQYVVLVGLMEAKTGRFQVKNMVEGTQEEVMKDDLIDYIINKIGQDKLDFYCPIKDLTE